MQGKWFMAGVNVAYDRGVCVVYFSSWAEGKSSARNVYQNFIKD